MERKGFNSVLHHRQLGFINERATRDTIIGNVDFIQRLKVDAKLEVHRGCVNTICWNDTGSYILSGSDDKKLCITNAVTRKAVTSIQSGHRSNIFSARFLPGSRDKQIVSCSGDGIIAYNDVERDDTHGRRLFNCHYGTAYEVTTVPNDPYTFLSCGEDYTVRWFDLRTKTSCMQEDCKEDILINCHRAVTSLAVNPVVPYHLGVGCSDSSVRVFDRRMLGTRATGNYMGRGIQGMFSRFSPDHLQNKYSRPTSLHYSADGRDILVSYSTDYVYLFNPNRNGTEEKQFSTDIDGAGSESTDDKGQLSPTANPVKKLRLRGDWSDTGPKARPRGEQSEESERPRVTIIQRMSEMLTRWLEDTTNARQPTPNQDAAEPAEDSADNPDADNPTADNATADNPVTDSTVAESPAAESSAADNSAVNTAADSSAADSSAADSHVVAGSQATENHMEASSELDQPSISSQAIVRPSKSACSVESEESSGDKYVSASSEVEASGTSSDDSDGSLKKGGSPKKIMTGTSLRKQPSSEGNPDTDIVTCQESSISREIGHKPGTDVECKMEADEVEGKTKVQYDERGMSAMPSDQDDKERFTQTKGACSNSDKGVDASGCSVKDNDKTKRFMDGKKRKRSVGSSPSGSLVDNTSGAICREKQEDKTVQHVVKSLRVQEGGKGPDDSSNSSSSSSSSDSDDDNKGMECSSAIDDDLLKLELKSQTKLRQKKPKNDKVESERESEASGKPRTSSSISVQSGRRISQETSRVHVKKAASYSVLSGTSRDNPSSSGYTGIGASHDGVRVRLDDSPESTSSDDGTPVFALSERKEDSHPQERRTSQFKIPTTRVRKMSVSGPPVVAPNQGFDARQETERRTSEGDVEDRPPSPLEGAVGHDNIGAMASPNENSTTQEQPESPSLTNSESDSDDDAILGPPRGFRRRQRDHRQSRGMSSDEPRDPHPALSASAENRLRELLRARQLRKEREKEDQQMQCIYAPTVKRVYKGHRNSRTMIKEANFWGDNYVMSGSDCGHVFIWDKHTSKLVMLLEGDRHVVNCVQPHPYDPVLATSGIDYDIKLWAPVGDHPSYPDNADEVMRINELMLEETRDTITVPPSFMLRMLASINHLNAERRRRESDDGSDDDS